MKFDTWAGDKEEGFVTRPFVRVGLERDRLRFEELLDLSVELGKVYFDNHNQYHIPNEEKVMEIAGRVTDLLRPDFEKLEVQLYHRPDRIVERNLLENVTHTREMI